MTLGPRRMSPLAIAAVLALGACASAEAPPPGPSPFRGARKIVLVRRVDDPRAGRPRDAIDALEEGLVARGYEARVVEVGPGEGAALRDLDRLEDRIVGRLYREATPGPLVRLGAEAGSVVAKLGADAVAGYHRLDPSLSLLAPPPSPTWTTPSERQRYSAAARVPAAALSLVAADGSVAWFPWGAAADPDSHALVNAADAIDALLAALAGDAGDR